MRGCPAGGYRLRDLALAALGAGALLADTAADLWVAGGFLREGHGRWAALLLALLGLSSAAAQLHSWAWYRADRRAEPGEGPFCTGRLLSSERSLALLHLLQLGVLIRYIHALEVGFQAYRNKAQSQKSKDDQSQKSKDDMSQNYKDYAYFLTHDISMLRLFETFIENTPQLTLVLYIVLSTNEVGVYQYVSMSVSFVSIAWAVQDYHQSLRFFLQDKHQLRCCSLILYFMWNLFLICPRILCLALFAVLFQYYVFFHFLIVWIALQLWVWLQQTDFMKIPVLEPFYRATIAVILYFSWFNVADGKTVFRSLIYYAFIITDSFILSVSWWFYRDPLTTDPYALPLIIAIVSLFTVGLVVRCIYYKWFHPKGGVEPETETSYDVVDCGGNANDSEFRQLTEESTRQRVAISADREGRKNPRMRQLSQNLYSS